MCTVIAAAFGAITSVMQGVAANSAAKAEARVAEHNARLSELQATDAVKRGGKEEMQKRREMARLAGRQRAMAAASGLDADSGSMADIQDASMREGEHDVSAIQFNAAREAWGHNVNATNYRNQASVARAAGRNALLGGVIGAGSSLLSLASPPVGGGSNTLKIPASGDAMKDYYERQWQRKNSAY